MKSSGHRVRTLRGLVLVAVMASLLACGDATPGGATGTAVIPWLDSQGTPSSLVSAAHAARECGAADLALTVGNAGALHGQAAQELELRNRATDACFLSGVPRAQLSDVPTQSQVSSGQYAQQRVDLAPGQSAVVLVGAPAGCAASANPRLSSSIRLTLPNGDVVDAHGTRVNTECGPASVAGFSATSPPVTRTAVSTLKPSIVAPQSVARGSTLTYQVRISNRSSTAIALSPCPSYTHGLGITAANATQRTVLLNCDAASAVGAATTLTYEMKVQVPASMPVGQTKLFWKLEVPDGALAGATISIT